MDFHAVLFLAGSFASEVVCLLGSYFSLFLPSSCFFSFSGEIYSVQRGPVSLQLKCQFPCWELVQEILESMGGPKHGNLGPHMLQKDKVGS